MKHSFATTMVMVFLTGLVSPVLAQKGKKPHPIVIKTGVGTAKPPDVGKKKQPKSKESEQPGKKAQTQTVPEDVVTFKTNFEKDVKCRALPLNAKVNIDFEDAPLYDVLKFIACITQRNFIIGGQGRRSNAGNRSRSCPPDRLRFTRRTRHS